MGKKINELGNKYGTMVVIREIPKEERPNKNKTYWELQCELCGEKRIKTGSHLREIGIKCYCQNQTALQDLTGQTFGRLTVVRMATKEEKQNRKGGYTWCQCSCGNPELQLVKAAALKQGNTQSCGCYQKEKVKETSLIDITGQRFGRLLVKKLVTNEEKEQNNISNLHACWWCDCDCGTKNFLVDGVRLRSGKTKSCGCLRSYGEELISQILQNNNIDFQKEYSFNDLYGEYYPLRFDFAILNDKKLTGLIECDGIFHHKDKGFNDLDTQQKYDQMKNDYCHSHNIPLLRIKYNTKEDIREDEILHFIKEVT